MKTALVTGAGAGIGAEIARQAGASGYRVGVFDRDGEAAFAVAAGIPEAVALQGDVTSEADLAAALDGLGAIADLVVANAGIVRFGPLLGLSVEDWRAVVDVNLTGTFLTARVAAARMAGRGSGAIVAVTSMNGVAAGPNAGAYGATKAAVALLVSQMAIEWGRHGIRVNAVAPGLIDGGMSRPIYDDPEARAARTSKVPLGRLGTEADVAHAVLFLASDDASYVSGQNLLVDGSVTGSILAHLPRPSSVDHAS